MEILRRNGYHEHKVLLSIDREADKTFCTFKFKSANVNSSYLEKDLYKISIIPEIFEIILEFSGMHMENIQEICEIIESCKQKYQRIKIIKVKFEETKIIDVNKIPDVLLSDDNISELHFHNCIIKECDENILYQKNKKLEKVSVSNCCCANYIRKQETRRGIMAGIMDTVWSYIGLAR